MPCVLTQSHSPINTSSCGVPWIGTRMTCETISDISESLLFINFHFNYGARHRQEWPAMVILGRPSQVSPE